MAKKYQKELDHTRKEEDGITEYEENFIPTPKPGPYSSDSIFDRNYCFDFFSPELIENSIQEFRDLAITQSGLPEEEFNRIEMGIRDFTNSSTVPKPGSALLYKSILERNPTILLNKFNRSGEDVKQLIQQDYFETFERFDLFKIDNIITEKSIETYQQCAETITFKRLNEWVEYSIKEDGDTAWASHLERILICRGINSKDYYHSKKKKDFLSLYKDLQNDFPFFERNLLTSYSLSPNIAEKFMVGTPKQKSERRVFLKGNTDMIRDRIFTSFLISPNFRPAQYEIICLPDEANLKIQTEFDNEIHAEFDIYK